MGAQVQRMEALSNDLTILKQDLAQLQTIGPEIEKVLAQAQVLDGVVAKVSGGLKEVTDNVKTVDDNVKKIKGMIPSIPTSAKGALSKFGI